MRPKSYKDLIVWQKSFALVKDVYRLSAELPKNEQFGLCSQIRRCAVSVPSNIAEGQQRNNAAEYRHFLGIAKGSAAELETQLLLVKEIYGLNAASALDTNQEVQKMLRSLINKLSPKLST